MNDRIKILDSVFSEYIRRRDSDASGYIRCISCGRRVHWTDADNGHFIPRGNMSLRYDERNCNAQCRVCNRAKDGNMAGYRAGMLMKYGPDIIDEMNATKWQVAKWPKYAVEQTIRHYRTLIKNMGRQQCRNNGE